MKVPLAAAALALALASTVLAEPARDVPIPPLSQHLDETWMLPVSSSLLRPGAVTPRALDMPGLPPFFLVGGDPRSLSWLRDNAARLRTIGAAGLAVEVADAASLERIRVAAAGLVILPVNGDDIAARLQIGHYPVLITATGLRQ
ncbi:integrating conjugative element protein [Pseudomonas sp. GD03721]|nr:MULTISPECIES: integrating conjugative element protein [unclassified Pseudomonas]MDH1440375.1 integrating conjugative element protein [Pseudomonas sp. GD03722]WGG03536.1 integrating conjugative element protein [Pseudomonas sp. GD03721]WGG07704.1 integrating conjugative element protein [Pseudomonas sp. GD03919]